MDLTAEFLNINAPFSHYVKQQKYFNVSMLSPNCFPIHKRNELVMNQQVYGIKLHGCFSSEEEQKKQCDKLQKIEKIHDIFPGDIRTIYEFDMDINDEAYKQSKIVYREEQLNKCLNSEFVNTVDDKKEIIEEEFDINNINESEFQKFNSTQKFFNFPIEQQNYACVVFYTDKMLVNFPHLIKDKKIPLFIVLGFFEKLSDAQKFVYSQKEEFPLIFTIEVGKWCAFDVDLMKNVDSSKHVERTQSLNAYKKLLMDTLNEEGVEEKERKTTALKDANVVTGQYGMLDTNKPVVDTDETSEAVAEPKVRETEEEKIKRELNEIKKKKSELKDEMAKPVKMSLDEFNKNLSELENINKHLKR